MRNTEIVINSYPAKVIGTWWTHTGVRMYRVRFPDGDQHDYTESQIKRFAEPAEKRALEWQTRKLQTLRQPF